MKKAGLLACLFLYSAFCPVQQDAREIVKKADDRAKGTTSVATLTIQTIRLTWYGHLIRSAIDISCEGNHALDEKQNSRYRMAVLQ